MSSALSSLQGSLEAAVQVVEDAQQCEHSDKASLKRMLTKVSISLKESNRRSVFWRLYHNTPSRRRCLDLHAPS